MESAPPPLRIESLTRRYGDLVAVDGLSLAVGPGEIVGFLGPNGAGKTTTLRLCAGLLAPDAGRVVVAGASLGEEPLAAKARLGFVPDEPFLYERLTPAEFLDFVAAIYDVPPALAAARAGALLERFELGEAEGALLETCSRGTRQKVSIAAALLHDPPLVLMDEPLNGLDPHAARALKDLLRERAARGLGVLVSTHLLEVAERLCDRLVIVHRGRKRAEGTPAELAGGRAGATLEDVFLDLTGDEAAP
ncbi:MAG TPA: ABC transporter ATP-binding protein [Candidatus Eisenbacteria bacterium]|jgi:ABC-2 type transport system ATP-binding protein